LIFFFFYAKKSKGSNHFICNVRYLFKGKRCYNNSYKGESNLKKHLISLMVLFLLVSTSLVGVSNQVTDDSFAIQQDSYQYAMDWSVHLTNQTISEDSSKPVYYNQVSNDDVGSNPLGGPMDSPWPMFGHDVVHTGRSSYSTENNSGAELWRVHGEKAGAVWGSAVIDNDGVIYFGTKGSDFSLYALYPNGTRKWRFHASGT